MASEIAQIVIDVAIPGGGTVLKVLELVGTLVQEVKDGKTTCIAVHERLTLILTELEDIQQRNGKLPGNAVDKYVQTLEEYWRHLQTYKEMNIVERVLNHRKLRATIESVNVSVDQLFQMVGLATTGVLMDWRKQYEKDMIEQQQAMEQVTRNASKMLAELQGIHEQTDAIVLLKDALDKMRLGESDLAPESQAAVRNAFGTITHTSKITVPDVPKWFIQEADITFNERPFGRGAFGAVHRGKLKDHTKVVIKMLLPGETGLDAQLQKAFLHEVDLWDTFNHPHVVRMLGACHVSKRPFIVCEDATNGNMVDYLARSPDHRKHLWRLLYEAAQGIAHLHSKNIVHGDLKLNNILVSADGKALIADFGLSRIKNKSKSKSMTARKDGQMVEGGVRWRAPELEKFLSQPQSDVFSFAMCILEAFLGEPPYAYLDDEAVKAKFAVGELPSKPEAMSDDAWELVRQMALPEPRDRISLAEVILKLEKFSEFELQQLSDTALLCDSCFMPQRDGDRFCSSCGIAIVPGAVAASVVAVNDVPTIAKLLQDIGDTTRSVENKTSAARLLYRQLRADTDKRGEVQSDTEIPLLFNLARDTTSTMLALYAFGSLCVLEASSIAVSSKELSEVQSFLLDNVQLDAINLHELSSLDTHMFVEIVGLLAGLGIPHRNDLRGEVQHIAQVFKGSNGEIRQAALAALAALTTGHEDNLRELRMVSVAAELVEAIKHGNEDDRDNAALLVGDLVTDLSTAEEFVKPTIIHVLVMELHDGTQKRKQLIASALGNIAAAPNAPKLIGVRGGVAALLTLLEAGENENLQSAVLSALRQILRDPSIGSMFVFCGGLTALEQSLTSSSADVVVDSLWALKTLVDADGNLRSVISQSSEILRVCFDRLKRGSSSEKSGAALVLRELVRGNPQVVRAVDEGDALHTLLDLVAANDPYARGAIINSFKTLLHAMPGKTSTQPEEEPSLKKTRFAPASSDVTAA